VPSAQEHHCPFLNRADSRCGNKHSLEHLDYAYRYCFDRYQACPVYVELLVERRGRRRSARAGANANRFVQVTLTGRDTPPDQHRLAAA
jgi:hypothetical protein